MKNCFFHVSRRGRHAAVIASLMLAMPGTATRGTERPARAEKNASQGERPREQSIYVPYDKLWQVFEKKGRGVFLPYEEFLELWRAADSRMAPTLESKPPLNALITAFSAEARVSEDVVTFDAEIQVEVLKKGWQEIPIGLGDVAITRASLHGEPARLVKDAKQGYKLLIENENDEPQAVKLDIEFAKSFSKAPGRNSVAFQSPVAPVSRLDVRVPESGVKIDIHPLLAATDVPVETDAGETRVLAFVGAAPNVRIEWTPKAEGAKGLKALANVKAEQQVWIDEGVTRTHVTLRYEISRTELSQLSVRVPADQKVVNVFDPNVREWSVTDSGAGQAEGEGQARMPVLRGGQLVSVQLFEPVKGKQTLVVELERFANEDLIEIPVVSAADVGRQQGAVVVKMGAGLRAEPTARRGLLQVDAPELPAALSQKEWDFAYRYAALPFALKLGVEKVRPQVLVDTLVEAHLEPRQITLNCRAVHDVKKAGVFRLWLRVPAGFEVRHVRGFSGRDVKAVAVDGHHQEHLEEDWNLLTVNLSRKARGRVGLAVELHKPLSEPDLVTPTGNVAAIPVPVPRATGEHLERESGRLIVYGPESLRVNPMLVEGLRPISHTEASRNIPATARPGERPVLSFAYADRQVSLTLAAERRAPHVTVRQLLLARIESGVVKYEATFFYDILYSSVKAVRIDIPAARESRVRVVTQNVRHRRLEQPDGPADLQPGYVPWLLESETEFMGSTRFQLRWDREDRGTRHRQDDRARHAAPGSTRCRPRVGPGRSCQSRGDRCRAG